MTNKTTLDSTVSERFNFKYYKGLVCTAWQTDNFNYGFGELNKVWLELYDCKIPYPIQDYPDEYQKIVEMLQSHIDENNLLPVVLISQSKAKDIYKLPYNFFDL